MATRWTYVIVAATRSWRPGVRHLTTFSEEKVAEETHAKSTMTTWKRISLFVALPVVSYLTWKNIIAVETHDEKREYFPWPHLRIRNKPFPWGDGDRTLFHNPLTNPVPGSREEGEDGTTVGEDVRTDKKSLKAAIGDMWLEYLHEDPKARDKERWKLIHRGQKRREEYLAKKRMKEPPLQPMDFMAELSATPVNPVDSEIDN